MSGSATPLRVGYELTGTQLDAAGPTRAATGLRAALERRDDVEVIALAHPDGPGGRVRRGLARELRWFPFALPRQAGRLGLDVLHCPMGLAPVRAPVPLVVTANDALAWESPGWMTRALVAQQRLRFGRAMRAADAVLAPSRHAADAITAAARLDPARVEVVAYGVDSRFAPGLRDDALLARHGIDGPYALAVGTLQPRKNLELALAAWDRLAAGIGHRLVVVGARGWRDDRLVAQLERSRRAGHSEVLGRVPDDELVELYRGADCLVHPSLGEGFGFPVLEAMACGTPVVAARAGSLPEVVGDAGMLFDPRDPGSLVAALREVLTSAPRRAELAERGVQRASRFTWERCAALTVEAYRAAVERAASSRRRSRRPR